LALLELERLGKSFGKLQAVYNLDLSVPRGEVRGLIGPNGAGKTTVFNLLTGFFPVSSGKIIFNDEDITSLEPHRIVQKGIAYSFQHTSSLLMGSTVLDNVLIGFHTRCRAGALKEFLHTPLARKTDRECRQQALEIIEFMGLGTLKNEIAGNLPHGHRRRWSEYCPGLQSYLLLLDEPVTGMNPTETTAMVERIKSIRDKGITIILVEHTMRVIMNICDRITVLNYGQKIAEGLPDEIKNNNQVVEAYLGKEDNHDAA
jgi:branched-chain amino acid transport system ATP-binding protein